MNDLEGEIEENSDMDQGRGKKTRYRKIQPKPFQVHIATALDGTTLFWCPQCHMAYPEKELLEQHLVEHKIFICDICGAVFNRKENLEWHKLVHNPERRFVCSVCNKGYTSKENLKLHYQIHYGKKTEISGECGKGFYRKGNLQKHTRSHMTRRTKEASVNANIQNLMNKDGTPSAATIELDSQNGIPEGMTVVALPPQDIQLTQGQPTEVEKQQQHQQQQNIKQEATPVTEGIDDKGKAHLGESIVLANSAQGQEYIQNTDTTYPFNHQFLTPVTIIKAEGMDDANSAQVQEYIQSIQNTNTILPFNHLEQFTTDVKKEVVNEEGNIETVEMHHADGLVGFITNDLEGKGKIEENSDMDQGRGKKKRYKKKLPKLDKPKPRQVYIATALDGTTLFWCPQCYMAYREKELLEQHLVEHKIERQFICDICGAGLKRKEHLERHKLGHNPERPFVCSVCNRGFKRKEHLNVHCAIHSGEKTEICGECGRDFLRKYSLLKHIRSHMRKRAKKASAKPHLKKLMNKDGTPSAVTIELVIPTRNTSAVTTNTNNSKC